METFSLKNIKTDATVENLLVKIWIVATGQAINKDIMEGLFAFKNQQDDWSHVGQIVNDHLNARLAGLGGNSAALYRELFKAAGVEYATATQLNLAIKFYTDRGALDPLSVVISMLLEPQSPHYAPLYQISKTQGVALLTSLGLNNADPLGTLGVVGLAAEDQTLSAMASTITDADGIPTSGAGAMKFQWLANGTAIAGATSSSFKLTQAEVGKQISVKATYTDNGGTIEQVTSTATGAVANVNDVPKGAVTIAGTVMHGQTLTVAHTITDEDGIPTSGAGAMKFQWLANGQAIAGATGTTLALGDAHVGKTISVAVSYTDNFGAAESVTSAVTAAVAQAQKVGKFDPVYYNSTNPFTGEQSVIDLRGTQTPFDIYRSENTWVDKANFNPARAWDFDGPVKFDNTAVVTTSSLPYPYWNIVGNSMPISNTSAPMAPIFDFSGGARTITIDLTAKVDSGKNWLLFKDFGADDRIVFVTTNPESTPGASAEKYSLYARNGWGDTRDFADFQEFTSYQAFAADGQADAQARYNNYFNSWHSGGPNPDFEKNGVTANVLYLKDQEVSYVDSATRMWDALSASQRANVQNPQDLPATSVGLLLIDSVSFFDKDQSGGTHFYDYIGKGADGIPDIAIGFVGTRPESFDFTGANYQGLVPPVYL
jgi:hypothetical protein